MVGGARGVFGLFRADYPGMSTLILPSLGRTRHHGTWKSLAIDLTSCKDSSVPTGRYKANMSCLYTEYVNAITSWSACNPSTWQTSAVSTLSCQAAARQEQSGHVDLIRPPNMCLKELLSQHQHHLCLAKFDHGCGSHIREQFSQKPTCSDCGSLEEDAPDPRGHQLFFSSHLPM
jgi:hypothetical protein